MKITSIDAIPVEVPKARPFVNALGSFATARSRIVRVQTDEGIEGLG
jgi:L-alanine-DL-glutamate epimerase-like enolase superfamily enzyme